MNPETKLQVAELDDLTIGQLASKYETLYRSHTWFQTNRNFAPPYSPCCDDFFPTGC